MTVADSSNDPPIATPCAGELVNPVASTGVIDGF
jgi:hypothetical protein